MTTQFTPIPTEDRNIEINGTPVHEAPPSFVMCETCGAVVVEQGKHDLWHLRHGDD